MSSSGTENDCKDESNPKLITFSSKNMLEIKEMDSKDVYEYIHDLHDVLKKQDKMINKYKNKINELVEEIKKLKDQRKELHVCSDSRRRLSSDLELTKNQSIDSTKRCDMNEDSSVAAEDAFNFVDEMRQAAEQAQNINNFIYEPTSGLYYDQKSGYYYNAEYGLYYDGNSGCYYNYNEKNKCYEFHSQVPVQPTTAAASTKVEDDVLDDDVDEVVFDEFGVVTNREKIKNLRQEKEQQKEKRDRKYKKKLPKHKIKEKDHSHRKSVHKKRKRSSGTDSDNENADKEPHKSRTDFEDGELSTSSSSSSSDSNSKSNSLHEKHKVPIFKSGRGFQDIAKKYPPSLRVIVQETNLEDLKVGNLSLITFKGGSLGRDENHDVIIPDVNVSKFHLKFIYDTKKSVYKCVDLGSRNGTILNGVRMSASKRESNLFDLVHGSVIQIAQTKLLCHVHEGNSTCGLCEPGLLIDSQQREVTTGFAVTLSHKEQLKKIQKKYGLENEKFVDSTKTMGSSTATDRVDASCSIKGNKSNYQDRAASRRLKVGSSTDKEKTQIASVDTAITSDNKGFRMLSKLGWNEGEALGKSQESGGLLEPINVNSNPGFKGLGCDDPTDKFLLTPSEKKKLESMKKTMKRYQETDIFSKTDEST